MMDPTELNKKFSTSGEVFLADNPRLYDWLPKTLRIPEKTEAEIAKCWIHDAAENSPDRGTLPVAIAAKAIDERLVAQQGVFTLHGTDNRPFQVYAKEEGLKHFKCIKINCDSIEKQNQLLDSLNLAGINSSTVYPDLKGLVEYLRWHFRKESPIPAHPDPESTPAALGEPD